MKQSDGFLKTAMLILTSAILLLFTLESCEPVTSAVDGGIGRGEEATISIRLPQIS